MRRVLVGAVAVLVCAWFVIGLRQSTGLGRAEAVLGTNPRALAPGQGARVAAALREAAWLNPDRQVELERSLLALDRGDRARARSLATQVAQAEPQNLQAWIALARTAGGDPALFSRALRHVVELVPLR